MRLFACMAAWLAISPAGAALPVRDPDWPCQAIKVPDLSLGSVWSGPSIDGVEANDPTVAALVARLVQRRLPIEQATTEIGTFAHHAGAARQPKLLAVFAGVFRALGQERASVLDGLDRYGRRQKQLADQVRAEADQFRALQAAPAPDADRVQQLGQRVTWDTRVFEDRRQMLSSACDVPTAIEQRLYALAQVIQGAM